MKVYTCAANVPSHKLKINIAGVYWRKSTRYWHSWYFIAKPERGGESKRKLCHSTEDHLRKNTLDKSEDLSKWALLDTFDYSSG